MKNKFSYLMFVLAIAVAGCAGYFSVFGLSQLFAGASISVIIMASVLEIGKVVTTTALHRYWSKIATGLKVYLTISVFVLMLITSAGIYGFLSNAYQKTANKLEIHEGEISILEAKKSIFQKNTDENQKIIDNKNNRLDQLSALRGNQENRLDGAENNRGKDRARMDIESSNKEIQNLSREIDEINAKNASLSDSINAYTVKVLQLKSSSDIAGEVGPLKYISQLTGVPMANVVNFLILLLIFVFDPLAIALVLMTNKVFELENDAEEKNNLVPEEKIEHDLENLAIEDVNNINYDIDIQLPIESSSDQVIDTPKIEEYLPDTEPDKKKKTKKEPVIPTGKVTLEDIREVKDRGYSVDVPTPKGNNKIERIGSNKVIKDGDNNKVFFKRG
jgi:hypothetical protein